MIVLSYPHCGGNAVIKFGTNRSGVSCCRRYGGGGTFTRAPKKLGCDARARGADPVFQRGTARALNVGRQTARAVRKKRRCA